MILVTETDIPNWESSGLA